MEKVKHRILAVSKETLPLVRRVDAARRFFQWFPMNRKSGKPVRIPVSLDNRTVPIHFLN